MPKKIEIEEIVAKNPQIDAEELEASREIVEQFRRSGIRRAGYRLALPFSGRRVRIVDNIEERTIKLHTR